MSDPVPKKACPAGSPAWIMTFADLMSLLLAFFVLLFSFSELDKLKYKQVAGSMKNAFGIQREVKIKDPPKGINIIANEFSPGKTEPTPLNEVRQMTMDDQRKFVRIPPTDKVNRGWLEQEGKRLRQVFAAEIKEGLVELEVDNPQIVIRILERGSFATGSTELIEPFRSVLHKMARAIAISPGHIVVAGHTDDVPIFNSRFRSNWALSAARAVTVVHELLAHGGIPAARMRVEGYADTAPIDSNDNEEGRARNRRVEVTLLYNKEYKPVEDQQAGIHTD